MQTQHTLLAHQGWSKVDHAGRDTSLSPREAESPRRRDDNKRVDVSERRKADVRDSRDERTAREPSERGEVRETSQDEARTEEPRRDEASKNRDSVERPEAQAKPEAVNKGDATREVAAPEITDSSQQGEDAEIGAENLGQVFAAEEASSEFVDLTSAANQGELFQGEDLGRKLDAAAPIAVSEGKVQLHDWNQKSERFDASERWLHAYGGEAAKDVKPDPISRIVDYVLKHITKRNAASPEQVVMEKGDSANIRAAQAEGDQMLAREETQSKSESSNRGQRSEVRIEQLLNARSVKGEGQSAPQDRNGAEQSQLKSENAGLRGKEFDSSANEDGGEQNRGGSEQGKNGETEQAKFSYKTDVTGRTKGTQKVSSAAKALLNRANKALLQQQKGGEVKLTRRLSIVLPSPKGGDIRLIINPGSKGHQVLFLGGNAATTAALQSVMPEIQDAVTKLPIAVSDIKVMADEAKKMTTGSSNLQNGKHQSQDDLDRRKRVQRRKGAHS